jgi:hypothetical protein
MENEKLNNIGSIMKQIQELKDEDPEEILELMNLWLVEKQPE